MLDRVGFAERSEFRGPRITTVTTVNPAANAEFTTTVPAGEAWMLLSVFVNMVATVQAPWSHLVINNAAGTQLFKSPAGTAATTAGTTYNAAWSAGGVTVGGAAAANNFGTLPENFYLGPGFVVASSTNALGANCDYGAASLLVVRYS